jgi:RNA polymerase sigma factor (sigma-70 family)
VTAPVGPPGPSDAALVERVLAADRDAFAQVYDRYGGKLFDFAYSMLRHREDASDAVADSFILFAERLPQLRDPDRLRPWLYAITRSECLRRLKARKRVAYGGEEQLIEMADDSTSPDQYAEQSALRQLVWDAAAGLADRDRALLDLHLRQGLDGAELGEAMGTTAANAYVMLNRLRAQVERSLGALLIARRGSDDCPDLADVLTGWDGSFSVLIRKRVARHIDNCSICAVLRKKMVSPWALLGTVPVFVAPVALRDRVLETELVAYTLPAAGGPAAGPGAGAGPGTGERRRGGWLTDARFPVLVGLLGILLLFGAVVRWAWTEDAIPGLSPTRTLSATGLAVGPTLSPKGSPSRATSTSATPSPSGTSLAPEPAVLTVSTGSIDLGRRATTATVVVGNDGGSVLAWTATAPAGWLSVSPTSGQLEPGATTTLTITADRSHLSEGRSTADVVVSGGGQSRTVTVTATREVPPVVGAPTTGANPSCQVPVTVSASDESGLASVTLFWSGPSGKGQVAMSGSGSTWSAEIGPVNVGGNITMYAVARDTRGNTATGPSRTIYVNPCPG